MNPLLIAPLITIAEQVATLIDQQIQASTAPEEQIAWNAARQFYLLSLSQLKAKMAAETPAGTTST